MTISFLLFWLLRHKSMYFVFFFFVILFFFLIFFGFCANLFFLSSHFSSQPNKRVFHPSNCRCLAQNREPSGLPLTTRRAWGPLEAPLDDFLWFVWSFGCSLSLSLSWWRKVGLPLRVWQRSWPKFKGITKGK